MQNLLLGLCSTFTDSVGLVIVINAKTKHTGLHLVPHSDRYDFNRSNIVLDNVTTQNCRILF